MPGRTTEGKNYASEYEHIYRGKYIYWFVSKGAPQFEWERIVLNSIPKQPMMIDALIDRLHNALVGRREELIGRQLGEHLRYRGLFNDNPVQAMSDADRGSLAHFLGAISVCIGFGLLSYWLLSSWVSWPQWANLASSVVGGIVFSVIYAVVVEPSRIGTYHPNPRGDPGDKPLACGKKISAAIRYVIGPRPLRLAAAIRHCIRRSRKVVAGQ